MHEFSLLTDHPERPGEPPDADGAPRPRRLRRAWRPLAWLAIWCWLMALVQVVSGLLGGLAGFGALMLAVAVGGWRLERWCGRQYWHGLREYRL